MYPLYGLSFQAAKIINQGLIATTRHVTGPQTKTKYIGVTTQKKLDNVLPVRVTVKMMLHVRQWNVVRATVLGGKMVDVMNIVS